MTPEPTSAGVDELLGGGRAPGATGLRYVVVPGIWNSGDAHWQSSWERSWNAAVAGSAVRIEPASWDQPDRADWVRAIDDAVRAQGGLDGTVGRGDDRRVVLVAHSLGCLAATAWSAAHDGVVAGAFLVASPDPDARGFPAAATGFSMPDGPVDTPTLVVSSQDDQYCSPERAAHIAATLGAELVDVGTLGHVNVASGVGDWPDGRKLLGRFVESLTRGRPGGDPD
ncbi:RBBP9/YdeN family alpha/beta hydrolase [Curtobacterium sp. Leaf261]|uniref:RBBP9/YdeN family alpha/beta hydrolase n=1 Tax=Curtobacterium sp. Leaf261 TaxID=1736311 RepID=UPI00070201F8|nr:alpha/beta hydrolase [Curtobacterium sp. Leaf261]KQO64970.1 hypothetical protein ASF23_02090 [Curtobacterium sp. Leaf261]